MSSKEEFLWLFHHSVKKLGEIKHFIIKLMHNIEYVDAIKIIKYLKVLQHVSDHRGSIIREPCTVLG